MTFCQIKINWIQYYIIQRKKSSVLNKINHNRNKLRMSFKIVVLNNWLCVFNMLWNHQLNIIITNFISRMVIYIISNSQYKLPSYSYFFSKKNLHIDWTYWYINWRILVPIFHLIKKYHMWSKKQVVILIWVVLGIQRYQIISKKQ